MPTVPLSSFLPRIMPQVPSCPEPLVESMVRESAITFCERTRFWRQDLAPMNVVANQADYTLSLPADTALVQPLRVLVEDVPLEPKTPAMLDVEVAEWQTMTGRPFCYYLKDMRRTLTLVYTPDQPIANGLRVSVALKPSQTASTVEQAFLEEAWEHVAAGALAILYAMPLKPWTNTRKADEQRALFERAIAGYNVEAATGSVKAAMRVVAYYGIG